MFVHELNCSLEVSVLALQSIFWTFYTFKSVLLTTVLFWICLRIWFYGTNCNRLSKVIQNWEQCQKVSLLTTYRRSGWRSWWIILWDLHSMNLIESNLLFLTYFWSTDPKDKPVEIPVRAQEKKFAEPPDFVRNIMGLLTSFDFHWQDFSVKNSTVFSWMIDLRHLLNVCLALLHLQYINTQIDQLAQ